MFKNKAATRHDAVRLTFEIILNKSKERALEYLRLTSYAASGTIGFLCLSL